MSTDGSAFRTASRPRFVMVGLHLFDGRLSAKAVGILLFCLSQPPGSISSEADIAPYFRESREAIASGVRELVTHGYIQRDRQRHKHGRFVAVPWNISSEPQSAPPAKLALKSGGAGTVYVLVAQDGSGRYKIGVTRNLGRRVRQLVPGLPFKASLLYQREFADPEGKEAELHAFFAPQRTHGEWFVLSGEHLECLAAFF